MTDETLIATYVANETLARSVLIHLPLIMHENHHELL